MREEKRDGEDGGKVRWQFCRAREAKRVSSMIGDGNVAVLWSD